MSIWDIHYDALYNSPLAVDAVLTVACGEVPIELRVIDKTVGLAAGFGSGANRNNLHFSDVDVMTIRPHVMVKAVDLASFDPAILREAEITFNGKTWRVMDHEPASAPTGEGNGEIRLMLEAA
ncbi:hypothetical protein [Mesorhizobium captivum]|uniref:hypothetical protein n=1 Tax=Mesorhizobium captivum TaxID=3072319 RepID=UPI002A24AEDD|nr:hypothetical protein [Mesorhizobium sp. VK23E]MDX8513528.1 hypothetical protein [Mesorhizobium sp. VK23E]